MEHSDESRYEHEEYLKWREQVNERLASLTTDTMMSQDRLDEIEHHLSNLDELLEGRPTDKHDNGLKGDIHDMGTKVNELWAVIFTDAAGNKGMLEEFRKRQRGEHRWEVNRTNLTAIVVAVISMFGLLIREWPDLKRLWNKPSDDKVEQMIERTKHPKSRRRHYTVTIPAEDTHESTETSVPQ